MSLLVLDEIFGLFVNILTAHNKYRVEDCENLQLTIQMQLPGKEKTFCNFLLHFWNAYQILNILKEKMIVIANVFQKLQTENLAYTTL